MELLIQGSSATTAIPLRTVTVVQPHVSLRRVAPPVPVIATSAPMTNAMAVGRALITTMTPTRAVVLVTQIVTTLTAARRESVKTTTRQRSFHVLVIATSAPMTNAMAVGRALITTMTPTRAVVLVTQIVTTLTAARRESVKTTTRQRSFHVLVIATSAP